MAKKKQSAATGEARRITVTQVRSTIGYEKSQAAIVRGIGLRRIGHSVQVIDHPAMRGMIHKVRHIVAVEE